MARIASARAPAIFAVGTEPKDGTEIVDGIGLVTTLGVGPAGADRTTVADVAPGEGVEEVPVGGTEDDATGAHAVAQIATATVINAPARPCRAPVDPIMLRAPHELPRRRECICTPRPAKSSMN
jgi:hypothetical protein